MVIDFHTHCFSDKIYERAVEKLKSVSGLTAHYPGNLAGLKASMARAGIDACVVQNIATKPEQTPAVNDWAIESGCEKGIISFGSVHPEYKDFKAEIKRLKAGGVKGLKFHPDYQRFFPDEKRYYPIYEAAAAEGMIMSFHCGLDVGLPEVIHCTPERFAAVARDFKGARVVGAHLGGHTLWDGVFKYLIGKDVYLDTSFGLRFLSAAQVTRVLAEHDTDKILFGTDAPWQDQKAETELTRRLVKDKNILGKILYKNAEKILGGV